MARPQHLPLSWTRRGGVGGDARCNVVWLTGEHDASTKLALAAVIDLVADLDGGDVVVDLSGVTFMDASIIGTLIGARNRLRRSDRSLGVRTPSACACTLLKLCRLDDLVWVPSEADHPSGAAAALGTWVEVPRQSTTVVRKATWPQRSVVESIAEPAVESAVPRGRS